MTSHHHGPKPDPDPMPRPPNTTTFTHALLTSRKKGTGIHEWLLLDSSGHTQVLEAGKHAIMRRVGLHARDLRILDPFLSYSSAVLGREKAIVINLEHIKAIITANEVLLLNSKDPLVIPFVQQLQSRVLRHFQATKPQDGNDFVNWKDLYDLRSGSGTLNPRISSADFSHSQDCEDERKDDRKHDKNQDSLKILPFEFVALEACLEAACSCLESETNLLEEEAHPALDKLTSKISTLHLERVRQIKSRLVAITGRVQKVRDELEHLLDDDEDMAEMYLTEKVVQWQLDNSSESSLNERDDLSNQDIKADHSASTSYGVDINNANSSEDHLFHETHTGTTHSAISKPLNVEELEMLLEAYFVQIDGTLHKLSTLREYVDDTEAYINIMLDDKQNQLLQMGVMLSTATLIISSFIVVVGILGMNIRVELFKESTQRGTPKFLWTIGACTAGCIIMYFMAVSWYKHKRFLE